MGLVIHLHPWLKSFSVLSGMRRPFVNWEAVYECKAPWCHGPQRFPIMVWFFLQPRSWHQGHPGLRGSVRVMWPNPQTTPLSRPLTLCLTLLAVTISVNKALVPSEPAQKSLMRGLLLCTCHLQMVNLFLKKIKGLCLFILQGTLKVLWLVLFPCPGGRWDRRCALCSHTGSNVCTRTSYMGQLRGWPDSVQGNVQGPGVQRTCYHSSPLSFDIVSPLRRLWEAWQVASNPCGMPVMPQKEQGIYTGCTLIFMPRTQRWPTEDISLAVLFLGKHFWWLANSR